jgi:hypothetical protein
MDTVPQDKSVPRKMIVLFCAVFMMVFLPAGCSREPADEGGNAVQADKLKSAPLVPGQNAAGNPQSPPAVKAMPENGSKSGEEEDQEEPESEPDDE